MLDQAPFPPRRDPRLLLIVLEPKATRCLAMDAWEVQAMVLLPRDQDVTKGALWRLFARARPSHVAVHPLDPGRHSRALPLLRGLSLRMGLPIGVLDRGEVHDLAREAPAFPQLLDQYHELRLIARGPRDPWVRAARIALGLLSTQSLPPRRYASSLPARPASTLDH